ncbi:hypothetical protein NIES4071_89580 [Calothrix sp. NIES-4071]|nr:hypothetical protein NIES4071_89580 [Calothrix sp. NIES-4071]BAZ63225.1 hypothetical protein NIES4105_89510 [Calothrix sp. NIES-4105]
MTFEMMPISNNQRKTMTAWADYIIEEAKQKMYKGENYLIWDGIYYCKAGDAWINESWWIETAKILLNKYNQEYKSWGVIIP